jgi:hypothetical protein
MRDDAPADPRVVDVVADGGDDARDLAPRDRGEVGKRERAHRRPPADRGVEEVDAGGGDVDEDLARAGRRIVDLLPAQVAGRAELVQSDRVHGGDRRTSSTLEVKELRTAPAPGMLGDVTHRLDTPLLALALPGGLRGVRVAG